MLKTIINKILISNQGSLNLLQMHSDKSFVINIIGLISISATIANTGLLFDLEATDSADTYIDILPQIVAGMVDNDKLEMLKSINIRGDKKFGFKLLEILSNLQISKELTQTDSVPLNIAIDISGKFISIIKNQLITITQNSTQSIAEYLQYETNDIVNKYEIEQFCDEVDKITEKTQLLIKRIKLLNVAPQ